MFVIDQPLPGLDRVQTARVVSWLSDQTCGEACWKAKEDVCRCECGGKNHGIQLREGVNGIRACKINGRRHELVAVGKHSDLFKQAQELCRQADIESGKAWFNESGELVTESYMQKGKIIRWMAPVRLDCLGQYELKYASLSQCLKWNELEYFGIADDRDRYHAQAAILWKRQDVPSYL